MPPAVNPPDTPGSAPVVIGKIYLMRLEFPSVLNIKSPIPIPPVDVAWHTSDSQRNNLSNIRSLRRRFGVVLFWEPSTKIAVVLIGTKGAEQPHRYVPFYGTARLPKQTREVLVPTPRDAFTQRPGYMNFTHAIRVVVVQVGDVTSSSLPAQSYFVDVPYSIGPRGGVFLSATEIMKLRELHYNYWSGLRYTEDGDSYYVGGVGAGGVSGASGAGGGGADGDDESEGGGTEGEDLAQILSKFSLNMLPAKDYSGASISSDLHNPVHLPSGLRYSAIIAKMSDDEDFRASQIELVDGSYTTTDDPPQISCHLMEVGCF